MMSAQSPSQLFGANSEKIKETIGSLLQFLERSLHISKTHTVDFYTQDIWNKLVAVSPDEAQSVFSRAQGTSYCERRGIPDMSDIFSDTTQQLMNLELFVEAAKCHSLMNMGVCTPVEELLQALDAQDVARPDIELKTDQFMNDKKSHEVLIMSQLIAGIAKACGVKQVIDLGAGKGYLSSYLSMRYGLKVYGIDSSHTNTDGANKRNRKLKKYWKAYKTHTRTTSNDQESDQKKEALLPKGTCEEVNTDKEKSRHHSSVLSLDELSISDSVVIDKTNVFTDSFRFTKSLESNHNSQEPNTDGLTGNSSSFLDVLPIGAVEVPSVSKSVCKYLSEQEKEQRKMENIRTKKLSDSHVYSPLTSYVTAETELNDIISDLEESIMVGLHTCGDLAPNTLRIYTAKPEIAAVCSVGCCYHLLSEEFESPEEERTVEAWGLPMSQFLRENAWSFGRNVRMSACLALERAAVGQGLPSESLFYRAVLQVIYKDFYGIIQRQVGKVFTKSSCFTDYVRKSLKKLGQDDSKLQDSQIMDYYEKYKPRKDELDAFTMLKVILAPCIEALILLDRLCYLKEQDNLAWAGIVKLFDPVKSPRCYAIVSMKKQDFRKEQGI
ncbi:putative methyltransferase-like protein 25 isoform 2-T3 [Discoglossus pictus]